MLKKLTPKAMNFFKENKMSDKQIAAYQFKALKNAVVTRLENLLTEIKRNNFKIIMNKLTKHRYYSHTYIDFSDILDLKEETDIGNMIRKLEELQIIADKEI